MRQIQYWDEESQEFKIRDATPDEEREFGELAEREEISEPLPEDNTRAALLALVGSMSNEEIQALLSANQTN